MRNNMEVIKSSLEDYGVKNKTDIINLVRSKSTKDRIYMPSSFASEQPQWTEGNTGRKRVSSQQSKR